MLNKDLVKLELKKLSGLPLINAGRACNLVWFGFGSLTRKEDKIRGGFKEIPEYALHIQCAWRLTDTNKIIVGSADKYIPSTKIKDYDNFDWDVNGANRCDEQLKTLFDTTHKLIVTNVYTDSFGSIKIFINDNILLEVFTDNSTGDEAWRFFKSGAKTEHLIITGMGSYWE